jgi:RNA polymerase-associated protein RTF1
MEAGLEEYQKITLPRRRLGRWCNEPYFKEAVMNCFVKLFIGENDLGKRCYRLCKIVEVKTHKPYQLPPVSNQKPVTTDKMLTLKFGKNQRDFPISLVSDAKCDEADMKQYIDATKTNRERTLGKKEANKMRRQQDKLVREYVYTTEDIEVNLRNRKMKGETAANLALERTRAAIAVQGARAALKDATFQLTNAKNANNVEEIKEFEQVVEAAEKKLEEKLIEEQIVKDRAKDRKMRLTGRTKDQKWALVNKRALEINQKVDRGEMVDKNDENENSAAKGTFNPYARRKVKPKILWEVGQKEDESNVESGKDEDAIKNKNIDETGEKDLDSTPALIQEHQHKAAALNQSHQFAIDEEVLAQTSFTTGISGIGSKKLQMNRVRKGLSLAEYQERKAAGTL